MFSGGSNRGRGGSRTFPTAVGGRLDKSRRWSSLTWSWPWPASRRRLGGEPRVRGGGVGQKKHEANPHSEEPAGTPVTLALERKVSERTRDGSRARRGFRAGKTREERMDERSGFRGTPFPRRTHRASSKPKRRLEGNARRPRQRRRQIPPRDSPVLCAQAPCPAPRSPCSSSSLEARSLAWVGSVRVFGRSPEVPFRSRDANGHRSRGQCARRRANALFNFSTLRVIRHLARKFFRAEVSRDANSGRESWEIRSRLFVVEDVAPFDRTRRKVNARARNWTR